MNWMRVTKLLDLGLHRLVIWQNTMEKITTIFKANFEKLKAAQDERTAEEKAYRKKLTYLEPIEKRQQPAKKQWRSTNRRWIQIHEKMRSQWSGNVLELQKWREQHI
jgi:Skp family chaperone for outer membrane proteins